jgi:hypothetical protein
LQAKERRNVELKIIIPHGIGDGVPPITEWVKLLMGSCKAFFLQVQPNFFAHPKLMWHPMLIMALLVLVIVGYLKPVGRCVGYAQCVGSAEVLSNINVSIAFPLSF